jgi:hypothetical protein
VYIIGNFSVVPDKKGWVIQAPPQAYSAGAWDKQGLPFYPWGMSYSKNFDIKGDAKYYEIELDMWNGTVSEISVNGKTAGVIAFPPYKLDISKFVRHGNNVIQVVVTGSLKNLLGPFHNNPPKGIAISPHWANVSSYPPGNEYQIIQYGLLDDFHLLEGRLE